MIAFPLNNPWLTNDFFMQQQGRFNFSCVQHGVDYAASDIPRSVRVADKDAPVDQHVLF